MSVEWRHQTSGLPPAAIGELLTSVGVGFSGYKVIFAKELPLLSQISGYIALSAMSPLLTLGSESKQSCLEYSTWWLPDIKLCLPMAAVDQLEASLRPESEGSFGKYVIAMAYMRRGARLLAGNVNTEVMCSCPSSFCTFLMRFSFHKLVLPLSPSHLSCFLSMAYLILGKLGY